MTANEVITGLLNGSTCIEIRDISEEDTETISEFVEDNGIYPWNDSPMIEWIKRLKIEGYAYIFCNDEGVLDATGKPVCDEVVNAGLFAGIINAETESDAVSAEDFDSVLN